MKKIIKRVIVNCLSGRIRKSSFPVFLVHGVIPNPGPFFQDHFDKIEPSLFEKQLEYLKQHYQFSPLSLAVQKAKAGESLEGYCALTFDDGYACIKEHAYPILEKLGIPATIFITSDPIENQSVFWRDQIRFLLLENLEDDFLQYYKQREKADDYPDASAFKNWTKSPKGPASHIIQNALNTYFEEKNIQLPTTDQTDCESLYLTEDDIRNAPSFIEFGNHSASHAVMPTLTYDEQLDEIKKCQKFLSNSSNHAPLFCFPFGLYNEDTKQAAKEAGYNTLVYHTNQGCNKAEDVQSGKIDRYSLPGSVEDLGWALLKNSGR